MHLKCAVPQLTLNHPFLVVARTLVGVKAEVFWLERLCALQLDLSRAVTKMDISMEVQSCTWWDLAGSHCYKDEFTVSFPLQDTVDFVYGTYEYALRPTVHVAGKYVLKRMGDDVCCGLSRQRFPEVRTL